MNPLRLYDYLVLSRARVLDSVRTLTPAQWRQPFPFGLRTIAATLTHTYTSEWYYIERLTGRAIAPYEQWPIKEEQPPEFAVIEARWREQAERSRAAIAGERDWARTVVYDSFPNEQGKRFRISATAGDYIAQLAFHEVHHRAQAMAMLRMLGDGAKPVQDVDFNDLMYQRQPLG